MSIPLIIHQVSDEHFLYDTDTLDVYKNLTQPALQDTRVV